MDPLFAAILSAYPTAPPLSAVSATRVPLLRAIEAADVEGVCAALDAGADIEASHEARTRSARRHRVRRPACCPAAPLDARVHTRAAPCCAARARPRKPSPASCS